MTAHLESYMHTAEISQDRKYRFSLTRVWDSGSPMAAIIGLNPSTANEQQDDPTIRRCISFAKGWGCGGIIMVNLFALRTVSPCAMKRHVSPEGLQNNQALLEAAQSCSVVVAAWGCHGTHRGRDQVVTELLTGVCKLQCLGVTKDGHPRHPLYLKKTTHLCDFTKQVQK